MPAMGDELVHCDQLGAYTNDFDYVHFFKSRVSKHEVQQH
jgi:hypothetical protein